MFQVHRLSLLLAIPFGAGCGQPPEPEGVCGNGVREPPEWCDGEDFAGNPCAFNELGGGTARCLADCTLDLSGCVVCGDGLAAGNEPCDGPDLRGESCASLGLESGTLTCSACALDTTGCQYCGDGVLEGDEQCEGTDLAGATCELLGFVGGTLACDSDCRLDLRACTRENPWMLWFDGLDDLVDCGAMDLGLPAMSHTLEAWIRLDPKGPDAPIFWKGWYEPDGIPPRTLELFQYYDPSEAPGNVCYRWAPCNMGSCAALQWCGFGYPGDWHHWAISFDGTAGIWLVVSVFVDGVMIASSDVGLPAYYWLTDSGWPVILGSNGCNLGPCTHYLGAVDEIRLWNYARTESEVMAGMTENLTGAEPGLLAYFPFSEGPGQFTTELVSGTVCTFGTEPTPDIADATWSSDTPY